jgi:hypothetical protein
MYILHLSASVRNKAGVGLLGCPQWRRTQGCWWQKIDLCVWWLKWQWIRGKTCGCWLKYDGKKVGDNGDFW